MREHAAAERVDARRTNAADGSGKRNSLGAAAEEEAGGTQGNRRHGGKNVGERNWHSVARGERHPLAACNRYTYQGTSVITTYVRSRRIYSVS